MRPKDDCFKSSPEIVHLYLRGFLREFLFRRYQSTLIQCQSFLPGAISKNPFFSCAAGPAACCKHGFDHNRAGANHIDDGRVLPTSSISHHYTLRSVAAPLRLRRRSSKSATLPLYLQYVLQRALARQRNPRYLQDRVQRSTRVILRAQSIAAPHALADSV